MIPMDKAEFQQAARELDMPPWLMAEFLTVNEHTVRRWFNGAFPPSPIAARLLRLAVRLRLTRQEIEDLTDEPL